MRRSSRLFIKGDRGIQILERHIMSFWAKVTRSSGCWEWAARKDAQGYGRIEVGKVSFLAHRFSFMLHGGRFPEGKPHVLHTCDNPRCVNPAHLYAGDDADNMRDAVARGRLATGLRSGAHTHPEKWMRGEKHVFSKLTEEQVRSIRVEYSAGGTSYHKLAKKYKVIHPTISDIVKNRSWKHIT